MSADEFGAIERLLKNGRRTAQRNKIWTRIHEETGAGVIRGKQLQFDAGDLQRLREYGKRLTGLDPMFGSTAGGRMELAKETRNEKLASGSVFGDLLVLATAGESQVVIADQPARTPPGSVFSVFPEALDQAALKQTKVVIVENGSPLLHWQDIRLPVEWRDSVLLYRGHGSNARHVQQIITEQPSENLALYFDFDPEGLEMALSIRKGTVLIPANWNCLAENDRVREGVNQREAFRRQVGAMKRLKTIVQQTKWESVVRAMEQGELAVMQEHITVSDWSLTVHGSG